MSEAFYNAKNFTVSNGFVRNPDRYYLEEYFNQRPALNAVATAPLTNADGSHADNTAIILARGIANRNFEVLGTDMTTALCTFNPEGGIIITTASTDERQAIIAPHLDTNQSSWNYTKWGTDNQVEWECAIRLPAIDNQKVWAGLKLTNDQLISADADQAFFKFQTDDTNSETFTDFTKLHFIYTISSSSKTYISQLPITVTANTNYKLRISIDSNRYLRIFVNGVQYNITTTEGVTGGTAVINGTTSSKQLTDIIDLIPYIGIEAGDGAAEALHVYYQKISRALP
jgi:hypothetical protein